MTVGQLIPMPKCKVQFKLSSFKMIPKEAGCYVLSTFEDTILYIGLSNDLSVRFQQHLSNPEKTRTTKEGKAIWFYYLIFDKKNLPKLERTWINHFFAFEGRLPVLNKVNSPLV